MTATFRRFAGWTAALAGCLSLAYTITFALYVHYGYQWADWASSIVLMVTALVVLPTFVALHSWLRDSEPQFL